ncbi:hypothetical protein C8J56DRAFT_803528, partial [Mycena floridula]
RTATVQLLLGNHPRVRDNWFRGSVRLENLVSDAKGAVRIQVSLEVHHETGGEVIVEQPVEGGPRKMTLFPDLVAGYPDDYEKYEVEGLSGMQYVEAGKDEVVGELPE